MNRNYMDYSEKECREFYNQICEGWSDFDCVQVEGAILSCLWPYFYDQEFPIGGDGYGEIRNMLLAMTDKIRKQKKMIEKYYDDLDRSAINTSGFPG